MPTRHLILISALLAGLGLAQEAAKPETGALVTTESLEKAGEVSDPDKIRRSSDAVTKMRAALKDVLGKLEEARNTKDVVKLNCVNDKLTQIKGLLRISEASDIALQEAVAKKETAGAEHEYTKVMIAQQKVAQLRAEAEQCIGQLAFRTDENMTREVQEPEDLPKGDPTEILPIPYLTGRNPPASPM